MIYFKVIKASRLCIGMAVFILCMVWVGAGIEWYDRNFVYQDEVVSAMAYADDLSIDVASIGAPTFTPSPTNLNLFAFPMDTPKPTEIEIEPEDIPQASDELRIEVVKRTSEPNTPKRILIYHTHTWEAYEPTADNTYKQTERWRTKDDQYNIVRVGSELASCLKELGFEVVHDTTAHEPPSLSTAYARSLETLEGYISREEVFDYYIDLHRDAYTQGMKGKNYAVDGDVELAKLMMLIGNGTGETGGQGFDQKPDWEKNIVLANALTESLNGMVTGLCGNVKVKTGRFNQHISTGAVLIEVGNNMNSLEQALASMPYLARAFFQVAK